MEKKLAEACGLKSSREVVQEIVKAVQDAKGKDLVVLNVSKMFDLSDYFIVVSGRSDRQVQGISNKVLQALESTKTEAISIEGIEEGQWVLIDTGDIVVHVFYEATREYYDFDSLWARAEKLGHDGRGLKRTTKVAA